MLLMHDFNLFLVVSSILYLFGDILLYFVNLFFYLEIYIITFGFILLFVRFKFMPSKVHSRIWEHVVIQDNEEGQKARCLTCGVIINCHPTTNGTI